MVCVLGLIEGLCKCCQEKEKRETVNVELQHVWPAQYLISELTL